MIMMCGSLGVVIEQSEFIVIMCCRYLVVIEQSEFTMLMMYCRFLVIEQIHHYNDVLQVFDGV